MGLIVEINIVVDLIELLHQGAGKLPAILEYVLIGSFKYSRLDGMGTLFSRSSPKFV